MMFVSKADPEADGSSTRGVVVGIGGRGRSSGGGGESSLPLKRMKRKNEDWTGVVGLRMG